MKKSDKRFKKEKLNVLDVRKPNEYDLQHIESESVMLLPLQVINESFELLDKNKTRIIMI